MRKDLKKTKFDLFVHKMNKKGQITRTEPYRLFIDGSTRKFEKPPGSGYFYSEDGVLISEPKKPTMPKTPKKEEMDLEKEILG